MSANLAPTTAALPPGGTQAQQSLFEHMASTAKGMPEGASPHQIGESLMNRLDSFMDRSHLFNARADALAAGTPAAGTPNANPPVQLASNVDAGNNAAQKAGTAQVDQLVHSLGKMFDYSIETQMVVRGATQISGSANTLLKGQ
ncbi:hypothetical protein [Pseudomonas sp. KNUC1026]|uniref:hypothetical protein n=1 Tax=Pseudomonas sp. KNUC1026 TaxID=2893890 RepID=UPI001F2E3D18|nr:hypothetical protein [Pseudomonas sp. KNUC1026]UFH50024.1 hypothetical protein LN139_01215 [Pseudomonas sp. KNUC1026]